MGWGERPASWLPRLAGSAGNGLTNLGLKLGEGEGAPELHVLHTMDGGSTFESAVFHNDGSLDYSASTPLPQLWNLGK